MHEPTWGFTVVWNGNYLSTSGFPSREEAVSKAMELAKLAGYRPPRWWEFRRRTEPDYERIWRDAVKGTARR